MPAGVFMDLDQGRLAGWLAVDVQYDSLQAASVCLCGMCMCKACYCTRLRDLTSAHETYLLLMKILYFTPSIFVSRN